MRSFVGSGAVALLVAALLGSTSGPARSEDGDLRRPGATARSINPLWDVPLSTLSATRDRPVFSPSRRPPPAIAAPTIAIREPPPPPPREPERPSLQLVGTVVGDAESFGIFLDLSSQAALRLRLGAVHEGWLLQSVKPRQVTLQKDAELVILPLPQPGDAEPQSGAAAPPPVRERMARRAR